MTSVPEVCTHIDWTYVPALNDEGAPVTADDGSVVTRATQEYTTWVAPASGEPTAGEVREHRVRELADEGRQLADEGHACWVERDSGDTMYVALLAPATSSPEPRRG